MELKHTRVLDTTMAYLEEGTGDPIVLLHGNPTSSYLWRNVIPHLSAHGRCIAPDLAGMGHSGVPDGDPQETYSFHGHRRYLEAFLRQQGVSERTTLVLHDWGSALGFDWARRHATQVAGIAYMEAIVRPLAWEEFPAGARRIFQGFRSAEGASMIIERNLFVERVLPSGVLRDLGEDHDVYRRPYETSPDRRRLMLEWPRQLPIDGHPRAVVDVVRAYADWLSGCTVPKLFINGEPGSLLVGAQREFCRTWPNQHEVTVPGIHFLPEDSPGLIGEAISEWMERRKMR